MQRQGLKVTTTGGDVAVVPTQNPDQSAFFQSGTLDAAWTVEPWVSRLEMEGGGRILVEEKHALTTIFVGRAAFVAGSPEVVEKLRAAHAELTEWIVDNPEDAKALVRSELEALTRRPVKKELVDRCWPRMTFTNSVEIGVFKSFVADARAVGFTAAEVDLARLLATGHSAAGR